MHGLAVYVKEELSFARDLSPENSGDSCLCFSLVLLHLFFLLYQSPSWSLGLGFDSISCNIDEFLLINPSADVFAFGDFCVNHKDCFTHSGATDRSGELCYNFSITNDLTQMVNLSNLVLNCGSQSAALSDSFVLQWLSLQWEILIMLLSQFPLTFQQIHNGMLRFIALLVTILVLIETVFVIF